MPKTAKTSTDEKCPCPNCGEELEDGACKSKDCGYMATKEPEDGCKKPKAKADGTVTRVDRIDYWGPLNQAAEHTEPMAVTASGALKGKAAFTCVGVFRYLAEDGTIRNEFRPPEEVFKEDSLDSWKGVTVTNGHPTEKVGPDNFSRVSVGSIGDRIESDAYNVYAPITVQQSEAIAAVQAGRTGLSGGYSCDMVSSGKVSYPVMGYQRDPIDGEYKEMEIGRTEYNVPGNWGGIPYDEIQTNIIGNHVALVDVPRGGDALHLRFDSADTEIGIRVPPTEAPATKTDGTTPQLRTGGETMKKIRLDGETVEHEVPEAVATRFDSMKLELASLTKDKADSAASLAAANAALETVKTDAAALAASIPSKVQDAVSARLALVEKADSMGVKVKHEDSDDAIKGAVILAAMPTVKVDDMDSVNLEAHFTAACSILPIRKVDASDTQRQSIADGVPPASADKTDGSDWGTWQAEQRSK